MIDFVYIPRIRTFSQSEFLVLYLIDLEKKYSHRNLNPSSFAMSSIAVFWNGFVLNGAKHWYIGHYLISKSVKLGSSKDIYVKVRVLFWVRIKWPIQPVISFYNMKPLRIWRDAILLQGYTPAFPKQFLGSHWHTRVERGALRKESRPWIRPGLEPRLHDPVCV